MSNDKITGGAQDAGFCCPYAYFCAKNGKHDRVKRMSKDLGIGEKAVEYNRAKFRRGEHVCLKLSICHLVKAKETT